MASGEMKTLIINSKTYGRHEVLVDDEDYDRVKNITWTLCKARACHIYYARGIFPCDQRILMHRFILGVPNGQIIDHIDRNGLNNQKSNLRLCTKSQNNFNSKIRVDNKSGYKGVFWDKRKRLWQASANINKKLKFLGYFKTAEEANEAREAMAKVVYGEFFRRG